MYVKFLISGFINPGLSIAEINKKTIVKHVSNEVIKGKIQ